MDGRGGTTSHRKSDHSSGASAVGGPAVRTRVPSETTPPPGRAADGNL